MIKYKDPKIYAATILPFGKNNIESLNRFVGSHKRYTSPTEFGSAGEVSQKEEGSFSMQNHGILLTPEAYSFCSYLQASVSEYHDREKKYGLSLYKSGLSVLGINLENDFSVDRLKQITGQLSYKITDCVFPVLNEGQQSILSATLQTDDLSKSWYKTQVYSFISCEDSPFGTLEPEEILENNSADVEALTDWVLSYHKMDNGILFIGMAAMLYIGKHCAETDEVLRQILYLKTCNKVSHHQHSALWSFRKQLQNLKESGKQGNYKILKSNNESICSHNDVLSKIQVFDNSLEKETEIIAQQWEQTNKVENKFHQLISDSFSDEVEKSIERSKTINLLTKELEVLSSELENRLELLMTRDSMTLNIILLILTIISLLGVGEVVGFNQKQWTIVALVILPFTMISFIYLRNFLKNFNKK
ncbi:MAG: hypothetical protein U9N86_03575 [Bacteroidota bacterium]|nr:hypothetical protein [Bacteroidota bacterium]